MNSNQSLIQEYFSNLSKFQYDKAKAFIEKSKESSKIWPSQFLLALLNFANGERNYNNLMFLSQRSGSRIGQDKYYELAFGSFDQLVKEANQRTNMQDYDVETVKNLSNQLIQLIEFRYQMISLYFELKDKEIRQEKGSIELSLKSLLDLKQKYLNEEMHNLIEPLKQSFCLEINILKNLLNCHFALDYKLDCIKSIISIKQINDIFNSETVFQASKSSKENRGFSIFNRNQQRQQPILYQWFKIYYQALLNKYSILMHDSFSKIENLAHLNDKIKVYKDLMFFVNKFSPNLTGILFDSNLIGPTNFRGYGYEIVNNEENEAEKANEEIKTEAELYPFIFCHPNTKNISYEKHMKNFIGLIKSEFDSKVKYHYDQNLKSSYYLYKISDYYTLVILFEMSKQENRTKITSIIQEIGDDLNLTNVYASFNQNLR